MEPRNIEQGSSKEEGDHVLWRGLPTFAKVGRSGDRPTTQVGRPAHNPVFNRRGNEVNKSATAFPSGEKGLFSRVSWLILNCEETNARRERVDVRKPACTYGRLDVRPTDTEMTSDYCQTTSDKWNILWPSSKGRSAMWKATSRSDTSLVFSICTSKRGT